MSEEGAETQSLMDAVREVRGEVSGVLILLECHLLNSTDETGLENYLLIISKLRKHLEEFHKGVIDGEGISERERHRMNVDSNGLFSAIDQSQTNLSSILQTRKDEKNV